MARTALHGAIWVEDSEQIRSLFTIPNPEYQQALDYGSGVGIPKQLYGFREAPDGRLIVPAGACELTDLIEDPVSDDDVLPSIPFKDWPHLKRPTLRDYQGVAACKALNARRGLLIMPPGAGKTVTALAIVQDCQLRPIVLVHTKDLMRQWMDAAIQHIGGQLKPIGGYMGRWKPDPELPVIGSIAMIQTLISWTPFEVGELGGQHGILIVDECHHAPAQTIFRLLWCLPGAFRIGLTATPKRADGLTPMLHWLFGKTLHEVRRTDLEKAGVSVRAQVRQVRTEFSFTLKQQLLAWLPGRGAWQRAVAGKNLSAGMAVIQKGGKAVFVFLDDDEFALIEQKARMAGLDVERRIDTKSLAACAQMLTEDQGRLDLVVARALDMIHAGRKVLILAGRIAYTNTIAEAVAKAGVPAVALTGDMAGKKRTRALEEFKSSRMMVAVATTLADEGLDVPDLTGLIMAFPGRSEAKTIQRAGRLMRASEGKMTPLLEDLFDCNVPLYQNQWYARKRAYKQAGCEFIV